MKNTEAPTKDKWPSMKETDEPTKKEWPTPQPTKTVNSWPTEPPTDDKWPSEKKTESPTKKDWPTPQPISTKGSEDPIDLLSTIDLLSASKWSAKTVDGNTDSKLTTT